MIIRTACLALSAVLLASTSSAQHIAIRGGTIIPMTGARLETGTVLIGNGKIAAVGGNVTVPAGATIVDATNKVIMPGLIDAMTYYGIDPRDLNEMPKPMTPELRVIDAFYPFGQFGRGEATAPRARELLAGGVTTIYIGPADKTILGGQGAVVKTAAPTFGDMILREPAAIDFTLGVQPTKAFREKSQTPATRMAVVNQLREILIKAQEYQAQLDAYETRPDAERATTPPPARNLGLEALARLLRYEVPARIQANRSAEIHVAIDLAEEFGFSLVIDGAASGHQMSALLVEKGIPVVLGPVSHPFVSGEEIPDRSEYPEPDERNAAWLTRAGVKVAFGSFSFGLGSLARGITGQWLLIDAAIASGYGLSEDDVLRAVTINGAEILGVADRVGSLEVGKDADVIVLDGDPLSVTTWVERVYVNGELVYERD